MARVLTTEAQKVLWDVLRQIFGDKVRLTSGTRTQEENIRAKGALSSRHLTGMALDIAYHPEVERQLQRIKDEMRKRGYDIRTEIVRPGEKSRYGTGPHIHFSIYKVPDLDVTEGKLAFPTPQTAKTRQIARESKLDAIVSRVLLGQLPMTPPHIRVPSLKALTDALTFDTGLIDFTQLPPNAKGWLNSFYIQMEKIRSNPIGAFKEAVQQGLVSPEFYAAKAMTRLGFKHLRPVHILSLASNPIAVRINGKEVHPAELLKPERQSARTLEKFLDDFDKKWANVRSIRDVEKLPNSKRREFIEDFSLLWVLGNRDVGSQLSALNPQLWNKIDQIRQRFSPFGPISRFAAGVAAGSLEAVGLSPLYARIQLQAPAAMMPETHGLAAKVGRAVGAAAALAAPTAAGAQMATGITQRIVQRRLAESLVPIVSRALPHTAPQVAQEAAKLMAPQVARAWAETTLAGRLITGAAMGIGVATVREPTLLSTVHEVHIPQIQKHIKETFPKRVLADITFFGLAHTLTRPVEFLTRKPITEAGFRVAAYLENRGANRFADIIRGTTLRIADAVANAPSFFAASEVSRHLWGIPEGLHDSIEAGIFGAALGAILGGKYKTELERLRAQDPVRIRNLEEQLRPFAEQLLSDSQSTYVDPQTGRTVPTFDAAKLLINYFREAGNRPTDEAVVLWELIRHRGSQLSSQVPSPQREVLHGFFAFDNPFAANAWLGQVLNPLFIGATRPTYPTPTPPEPTSTPTTALAIPSRPTPPPSAPPTAPPTAPMPPAPTPTPLPTPPTVEEPSQRSQLLDFLARQLTRAQRARERNLTDVEQEAFNQAHQARQQLGELSLAERSTLDQLTENYRNQWRLATPDELRADKLPTPTAPSETPTAPPEVPTTPRETPTTLPETPTAPSVTTTEASQALKTLLPPTSPLARKDAPPLPDLRRIDPEVAEHIIATYITQKPQRPTSVQEIFNDLTGEVKLAGKTLDRREIAIYIFNNWDWLEANYKQAPQEREALPTPPEAPTPSPAAPPPAEQPVAPPPVSLPPDLANAPIIDFSQRPPYSQRQRIVNDLFPEVYTAAEEENRDPERIEPLSKLVDEPNRVIIEHEAVKPENVNKVIQEAEKAGLQWQAVRVLHPRFGKRYHIFVYMPETPTELVQRAIQLRTSDIAGVDLSLADHVELGRLMNQDVWQFLMDIKERAQELGAIDVLQEAESLLAEIEEEQQQLRDDLQQQSLNFFREQVRSIIPDVVHDIEQPGKPLDYVLVSEKGRAWREKTTGLFIGPVVRDRSELEEIIDATLIDAALERAAEDSRFRYAYRGNVRLDGTVEGQILRPDEMPDKVPLDALYFGLRALAREKFGTDDVGVKPETIWSVGTRLARITPTTEEGEAYELPERREERPTAPQPTTTVAIPERPQPPETVEGLREPERPRGVPEIGVVGRPGEPELGPPAPAPTDVGLYREPADLGEEPGELRPAEPRLPGEAAEVRGLPAAPSVPGVPSGLEPGGGVVGEGLRGRHLGTAGAVYGPREPTGLEPMVAPPERRTVGAGRPTEPTEGVGRTTEGLVEPARRPEGVVRDRTWDQSGGRVAQYQPRVTLVGNTRVPTSQEALDRTVVEYAELAGAPMPDLSQVQFSPLIEDIVRRKLLVAEQLDAVALILHAYEKGHGAIIADDVGLGKSRIMGAAAFELIQKGARRIVIISHNEQVVEQIRKEFAALIEGRQEGPQVVYERPSEIAAMNRVADFTLKNGIHLINIHKLKSEQKVEGFSEVRLPPDDVPQIIFVQSASSRHIPDIFKRLQQVHIDAVFVDESHDYKNIDEGVLTESQIVGNRGAQRANNFIDFQQKMLAKGTQIFYFSATPAQDPEDFSIYLGLRLWRHPQDFAAWWANVTHLSLKGKGAYRKEQEIRWLTQLMRELKIRGYYLARDLWRGGTEFELRPEMKLADLPPEDASMVSDRRVLVAAIARYWNTVMGVIKRQKGIQPVMEKMHIRSMLQFDLKRFEAYLRRHEVFRTIDEALQRGEQVVIYTEFVGEEEETSYLAAAINALPTRIKVKDKMGNIYTLPIEGAEEVINELRELASKLPRIPSIVDLIINRYGRQRVANLTGYGTSAPTRIYEQNEFQAGKRDIAIISKTGTHGINLHDVNGRRRVLIFLDVPWSAIDFKQILGRVDRYGQRSSPRIVVIPLENPLEKKLLGTIAQRLASLGVLSKGTEQLQIIEGMEKYDINDPTLREVLKALAKAGVFDPYSDNLRNLEKEAMSGNIKAFYLSLSLLPPEHQAQIVDLIDQQLTNLQIDLKQQGLIIERGVARTIARISDLRDDNLPLEVLHIRSAIGTHHILIRGVFLDKWSHLQQLIGMHNLQPSLGVFQLESGEVVSGVCVPYSTSLWDGILRTLGRPTDLTHDQLIESLKDGLDVILQFFVGPRQMRVRIQRRHYPSIQKRAWVLTVFDEQSAHFRDPNASEMRAIYESAEGHAFTHDPRIDKFVIKGVHTPDDFDRPEVRNEIAQALTLLRARTSLSSQPIEEARPYWYRGGFIFNPFSWFMRHFGKRSPRSKKVQAADKIINQIAFDSQFKPTLIDRVVSFGDQAIYFFVDHMWGITKTVRTARKIAAKFKLNIPLSLDADVAYDEFLASVTLARAFVRDYFVPWWRDIVQSGEVENVLAYLVAMHALELNAEGIESGISDQDALNALAEIEDHWNNAGIFTEMMDRTKAFVKMNNMLLDMLHDEGIISDEAYNEALTKWQFYVPFRRWIEEAEAHGIAPPGASNFDVRGQNVFLPIKGSQRKIINPIEVFLNKVLHVHRLVYRNRVPRKLIEMVEFLADALRNIAANMGVQPEDLPEWDFVRGFEKLQMVARRVETREEKEVVYIRRPEGRDIIHFFRNGKIESWRVPPLVAATLKQIDLQIPTVWSKLMTLPTRLIRVGATSWRINWTLFNLVRDQFFAWFNIPGISTYIPFATAVWFWLRVVLGEPKARRALERFFKAAAHTYTFFNEYQDEIEQYLQEFERLGLKPSEPSVVRLVRTAGKLALLPVKLPITVGEMIGQWSEFFTRISAFARVLEITGDEQLAAKIAREIPNYRRHGVIPFLAFAPFVNARIQAIRQVLRAMFVARPPIQPPPTPPTQPPSGAAPSPGDRPWGYLTVNSDAAAKAFFLMLLGFLIYALFNRDKKGFWELVSNARYAFAYDIPVFIFSDNDRYLRLPVDESLKIFVVLGMLMGMTIDSEDPQAMENLIKSLFSSTIAIVSTEDLVMAFSRGILEWETGFELFSGRRIVPESLEVFPPELQYTRRTTEFFKWLGRMIKVSPEKLQVFFETHIPATPEWTVWLTPQQILESAKAFFAGTPQPKDAIPPRLIPIAGRFIGRVEMTLPPQREEIEATVIERALEVTRMGAQVGAEVIERRYWAQAGLQPISREERPVELERLRRLKERDPQRYKSAARAMVVRRLRELLNLARENALQPSKNKQVKLYNLFKETTNWLQEAGIIDEQGRVRRQDLIDLMISVNPQFGFIYRTVIDSPQSAEVRALRLRELAKRDRDLFRMVIVAGLTAGHRESISSALKIWMQKDPQSFNEAVQAFAGQ